MPRLSKIGAAALAAFGWTGISSVTATYLVIAGGGGGGSVSAGGGGGAGGVQTASVSLNPTISYTVIVGGGGTGASSAASASGANGSVSSITGAGGLSINSADGGGGGAGGGNAGSSGGSGGGGQGEAGTAAGAATSGGNSGGAGSVSPRRGGGGGGRGADGSSGSSSGNGGNGTAYSISGTSVTYAGGGGGGAESSTGGSGGTGGGGSTGGTTAGNGGNGTANLGGGGAGANRGSSSSGQYAGGNGGSGIVIISYVGAQQFSGGVVTTSGGNTIHTFTTSGTLGPITTLTASALVVAGGGGGGYNYHTIATGGGGGAGGYRTISGLTIDPNSTYLVTVGAGGAGSSSTSTNGSPGTSSAFSSITSAGGGYGATNQQAGGPGGSGGGASGPNPTSPPSYPGGAGNTPSTSPVQGYDGGSATRFAGGGGGGSGGVGGDGSTGIGGVGTANSISGSSVTYATGGGGNSSAGAANTGNGGDRGTSGALNPGFAGGSGVVIISYPGSTQLMAGGTVTIAGGNVIHTFTSTGYLAPLDFVGNSLRFRSSASAYLSRTFSTNGTSQTTNTFSLWAKRGTLGTAQQFFEGYDGTSPNGGYIGFDANNNFAYGFGGSAPNVTTTTQLFRDPAAWYHFVIAVDTTQATASNRIKFYVNGVQITAFNATGYPAQNAIVQIFNRGFQSRIGASSFGGGNYFDGYMAEVNFVDGQALTPNSFGTFNSFGVWQPITYGGSYGTNGFYLPFPNSATGTAVSSSYLVVAGGGGGGSYSGGGGGGAGGLLSGSGMSLNANSSYTVVVGAGGVGGVNASPVATSGSLSSFNGIAPSGGGFGGGYYGSFVAGAAGGSGGGAPYAGAGSGTGTSGQGNNGGSGSGGGLTYNGGGGGGGAGAVGGNANTGSGSPSGNGGAGSSSSISGASVTYAGGGGGGNFGGGTAGSGGAGGGGTGGTGGNGAAGTANRGGGGGGSGGSGSAGGAGGSGIVVVSYAGAPRYTGGTVTTSGGNTIHTFTSSGVLTSIFNDFSPQGNNWTGNNFNVTTNGATYDSMTDVPTLTSTTAANYSVWNPLAGFSALTLSDGNIKASPTLNTGWQSRSGTMGVSGGKWYAEFSMPSITSGSQGNPAGIGIVPSSSEFTAVNQLVGDAGRGYGFYCSDTASNPPIKRVAGSNTSVGSGSATTTSDVFMVAFDLVNGNAWFGKNGTWYAGNPSAGTGASITGIVAGEYTFGVSVYRDNTFTNNTAAINLGQQPFAYTPPTGFVGVNAYNL